MEIHYAISPLSLYDSFHKRHLDNHDRPQNATLT